MKKNNGNGKKVSELHLSSETLSEDKMFSQYKKSNIIREYVEVFNLFSKSLMYTLHNTYLGSEYIKNTTDIEGHFQWCFNKVSLKFKETLNFNNVHKNKELYNYFLDHSIIHIYNNTKYCDNDLDFDIEYIDSILNFYSTKTEEDLFLMIELYYIFNKKIF